MVVRDIADQVRTEDKCSASAYFRESLLKRCRCRCSIRTQTVVIWA